MHEPWCQSRGAPSVVSASRVSASPASPLASAAGGPASPQRHTPSNIRFTQKSRPCTPGSHSHGRKPPLHVDRPLSVSTSVLRTSVVAPVSLGPVSTRGTSNVGIVGSGGGGSSSQPNTIATTVSDRNVVVRIDGRGGYQSHQCAVERARYARAARAAPHRCVSRRVLVHPRPVSD
jgi:hypothetical protein